GERPREGHEIRRFARARGHRPGDRGAVRKCHAGPQERPRGRARDGDGEDRRGARRRVLFALQDRVPRRVEQRGQKDERRGDGGLTHRSTSIAIPWPTPMQSAAMPLFLFFAFIAWTSVVNMRAPLDPIGWPRAIAPPLAFTFSTSSSRPRTHAI